MRTKLQKIRQEAIDKIKAMLEQYGLEKLDLVDAQIADNSPIIQENNTEPNLSSTLDSITIENGEVVLNGSSCYDNCFIKASEASTDSLIDIAEYLEYNEAYIKEYVDDLEPQPTPKDHKQETYDRVCRVLTEYEHPQDSGLTEMEAANGLYDTLRDIQNHWQELTCGEE